MLLASLLIGGVAVAATVINILKKDWKFTGIYGVIAIASVVLILTTRA